MYAHDVNPFASDIDVARVDEFHARPEVFRLTLSDLNDPEIIAFLREPKTQEVIRSVVSSILAGIEETSETFEDASMRAELINDARLKGPRSRIYVDQETILFREAMRLIPGHTADQRDIIAARAVADIVNLGPLAPIMADVLVGDIFVNSPTDIRYERAGVISECPGARFYDAKHVGDVASRMLAAVGITNAPTRPLSDAILWDGSRLNIVHPILVPTRMGEAAPLITMRRFPPHTWTLLDMVERESITQECAIDLAHLVAGRASLLFVGGTGSGKSSMMNACSGSIPLHERIVTIQDAPELRLHPDAHVVDLQTRDGSFDGRTEAITTSRLIKNALRMRPDRIIVGEIRDVNTALDVFDAMATGHEGSMSSLHANSAEEAADRITVLLARNGVEISDQKFARMFTNSIHAIGFVARESSGRRRLRSLVEVGISDSGAITYTPVWAINPDTDRLERVGEWSSTLHRHLSEYCPEPPTYMSIEQTAERARYRDEQERQRLLGG